MSISDVTRLMRFNRKVNRTDGCWEWTAQKTASGYGMFLWAPGSRTTAHRVSYRLFVGEIPDGFEVDHLCRNRGCVNPAHLEAVSVAENRKRRDHAKGQRTVNGRKTTCRHGHPYAGENVRVNLNGGRACRTCQRETMRRYRERLTAKHG